MAVSSIKFSISVDTKELSSNLKSAQSAMKDTAGTAKGSGGAWGVMTNGLKGIGKGALDAVGKIGKMALSVTVFKAVNTAINMVTGSLGKAITRIDTMNNSQKVFENMGFAADETERAMRNLEKSIDGLPTPLDQAVQGVQMFASGMRDIEGAEQMFSAVNNAVLGFGGSAQNVTTVTQQLSQAFAAGKIDGRAWQSMMSNGLGPALNAMADNMGITTAQLREGLSEGSISVEQFKDAFVDLNENGTAEMASLQQMAQDMTSGISTSFANLQTAVVRGLANVIMALDELILKVTGKDIAGWIGELRDHVNNLFKGIVTAIQETDPELDGFMKNFKIVFTAIKDIALTVAEVVWDSMQKLGKKIGEVMVDISTVVSDNKDTIATILSILVEVFTGVMLGIGDTIQMVLPWLDSFAQWVGKMLDAVLEFLPEGTSLSDVVQKITPWVILAITAFKGLKGAISIVNGVMKALSPVIKAVKFAFKVLKPVVGFVAKVLGVVLKSAVGIALKSFAMLKKVVLVVKGVMLGAFKAVGAAVMAHPIVAAIAVLIAAIIYLWTQCEWFRDGVIALWEFIKEAWLAGIEVIWEGMKAFGDFVVEIWNWIKETTVNIWNGIKDFFVSVWEGIKGIYTASLEFISNAISTSWNWIKETTVNIWNGIKDFFTALWEGIKSVCKSAVEFLSNAISTSWDWIKSTTVSIWNGIKSFFSAVWDGIKNIFTVVLDGISKFVSSVWDGIKRNTTVMWNAIKNFMKAVWDGIKSIVSSAINIVQNVVSTVWNAIKNTSSIVWEAIKNIISKVWEGIKSLVSTAVNMVRTIVTDVFNGIKSVTTTIWNGVKDAMVKPVHAARDAISTALDKIKGFFSGLRLKFPDIVPPKLPKFSLTGQFSLMPPSVPKVSMSWYQTGGIFTGASVIGVGENGDEAVVPLSNKSRMAPFAKAVADLMPEKQAAPAGGMGGVTVTGNTFIIRKDSDAQLIGEEIVEAANRADRAKGKVRG
ncbi:tape measure protein [Enterococcus casseliflavus]|uniref:tape measure protein n=1 Tax=Enterococcus casseliflavus TaxID=37734 RepID=UPI0014332FCE|nr:tape measure protein [Enterococcus casseliflavus]NKD38251.1 tape measure protein [Enterococcus casseliflavus]